MNRIESILASGRSRKYKEGLASLLERYRGGLTIPRFLLLSCVGGMLIFVGAWIFYRLWWLSLLVTPLGVLLPIRVNKQENLEKRERLLMEFGDFLSSAADALRAGMSFERAVVTTKGELEKVNGGKKNLMSEELESIISGFRGGIPIAEGFRQFSRRWDLDEIDTFAGVLPIVLRKGGDLAALMKNSSEMIRERSRIKGEIQVILAEKKMEKRLVDVAPFLMMYMLCSASPEFMAPVFGTLAGRVAITVAISLFILAWVLSAKIMDFEV